MNKQTPQGKDALTKEEINAYFAEREKQAEQQRQRMGITTGQIFVLSNKLGELGSNAEQCSKAIKAVLSRCQRREKEQATQQQTQQHD